MNKSQEIKLYGEIGFTNNGESFSGTIEQLEQAGCKNLTIRLHSYGGSVFEGVVMFNALLRSRMHTKIIIDGIAASMASLLLVAVNEVEITENGFVMIHNPSSSASGNAHAHRQTAKLLLDIESNFSKQYSALTGLGIDEINSKWFDGKDHWLNADEAVKFGFANRKIPAVARNLKSLDKETVSTMSLQNVYDKYAATFINENESEMKKELIELFELDGLTEASSDTAVLNALKEKWDELKKQVQESSQKEQEQRESAVKSMLDGAIKEGKITASQKPSLEVVGKTSGIDVLASVLNGIQKQTVVLAKLIKDGRNQKPETSEVKAKSEWGLEDYRMHAPRELMNDPKLYDELVKKEHGSD